MNKFKYILVLFALIIISCNNSNGFIVLDSSETNIDFSNDLNEDNNASILDYLYFYNGGGVGLGDFNQDGLMDIYFSGNQTTNKLYLNLGNFKFKDITESAGVGGKSSWNTGVTIGDFNNDGLEDIYVSAVVGVLGFQGHNELFINNGDLTFSEKSKEYGLDFRSFGTSAALLDFDLDGDLDLYLLNHAIHNQLSYGKASNRNKRSEWGDKLLENTGEKFVDISIKAGIFGSPNGYGLSVSIADFNNDNYPDIYVNNDFYEDDYYYINNGDGSFSDLLKENFGHTSKFSMGNDVADINNDGYLDLITLDMLPDDETILKNSATDDTSELINLRVNQLGYHYQYARNMLQLNQKGKGFSESALQYGIAATDWSWGAIFTDFNNDGINDLFVSNGILRRPNDLDYIKYLSNDQIKTKLNKTHLIDKEALEMMPSGIIKNKVFEGAKTKFEERTYSWLKADKPGISNGIAVGDLNNDGLIDVVTNNINQKASIYQNILGNTNHFIRLDLKYDSLNRFGIGSKAYLYTNGQLQFKELYQVRGFESSSERFLHFGIGENSTIDSLVIQWPNGNKNTFDDLTLNTVNTIVYEPKSSNDLNLQHDTHHTFSKIDPKAWGISIEHKENNVNDFDLQKLIPYKVTDRGPVIGVGDLNNDKKEDLFIGSSNRNPAHLFLQGKDTFNTETLAVDDLGEETSVIISDLNQSNSNELIVSNGGGFFKNGSIANTDLIIGNKNFNLNFSNNTSFIKVSDFNSDGLQDLFICESTTVETFGTPVNGYVILQDENGFESNPSSIISFNGNPNDAVSTDFNNDGVTDLIVVGEWMSPVFLKNDSGILSDVSKQYTNDLSGLWKTIYPYDIDRDGDIDYMLGNWGLNSKFTATHDAPLKMYINDFDKNGSTEPIVCTNKNGSYFPIVDLNLLTQSLVLLFKDKFNSYKNYAGKPIEKLLSKELLANANYFEAKELSSGYLKNNKGQFEFVPFEKFTQIAPINTFVSDDFDKDGNLDLLMAGNYFGVPSYQGKLDGFSGAMISNQKFTKGIDLGLEFLHKQISDLKIIHKNNKSYLIVGVNNEPIQIYEY